MGILVLAGGIAAGAAYLMSGDGNDPLVGAPVGTASPTPGEGALGNGGTRNPRPTPSPSRTSRPTRSPSNTLGATPDETETASVTDSDSADGDPAATRLPGGPTPTPVRPGPTPAPTTGPPPPTNPPPPPPSTPPPPRPAISLGDASVTEGATGETIVEFTIGLSVPAPPEGVDVGWAATSDPAYAPAPRAQQGGGCGAELDTGADYAPLQPFALTIPQGHTGARVGVRICGDLLPEPDEFFAVGLTYVSDNADVADGIGLGRIVDDEPG